MNSLTRIMSYDKTKINQKCDCEECVNIGVKNQTVEYPPLTEEEIEQIINERYNYKDEKTKKFIRKALRKHGDRYDYSNVVYIKSDEKVEIICRVEGHDPFPQTPSAHSQGQGCSKCKSEKLSKLFRMTFEEFIEKANEIHNNKYDYSKVDYKGMNTRVTIICPIHGDFPQKPSTHLNGSGCKLCGIENAHEKQKLTKEEFIEKSNIIHGIDRYDYSKVKYVNNTTDVIIICHNHDEPYEFKQKPNNHMKGQGCKLCSLKERANKRKMTKEEFIEKAREVHGDKYDYSKVEYNGINIEVIIICHNHETPYEFPQTPHTHLNGSGCPLCAGNIKLTLEEFIEKSNKVHGKGTYDYSKVNYINAHTDVIIICPKENHGGFPQTPNNHLNGQGCPYCNESKGARKIRLFLINNNIEFEREKRFDDCRDKNPLPFDFYVPQYNLCIEYDGEQHFIPTDFTSSLTEEEKLEKLKTVQFRDQIKNNYCKQKEINLLRIKYTENVEEKLIEYCQTHKFDNFS